jgi:anaerobic selenocysteine-containing dehydrogenase
MFFNVNVRIDCIVAQDIEMTSSCEYADIVLPALSWPEFQTWEMTASCSIRSFRSGGAESSWSATGATTS